MDAASVGEGHAVLSGNASEELGFVVAGYVKNSRPEGALRVFKTMVGDANVRPSESPLRTVLIGGSSMSALRFGRDASVVHEVAVE
jgi:pentatricopeptide repeat protein